jgi:hypothetical protein
MKNKFIVGLTLATVLLSCNTAETEIEVTDALATTATEVTETETVEEITGEESTPVAFMGEDKGTHDLYGHTDFDNSTAVSLETMFSEFTESKEFTGAINVTINEVCQNAGCWIRFQKPNSEESVMVFFRDHYTIPIDASLGKEAILYGQLKSDTMSVEFQKHLLDDAAANGTEVAQAEYDAITEDKIDVSFDCESILIKK